jgi:hypothetical protein
MPIALTQCPPVGTLTPTFGVINLTVNKTCLFHALAPDQGEIDVEIDCYLSQADFEAGGQPLRRYTIVLDQAAVVAADAPSAAAVFLAALQAGPQTVAAVNAAIQAINATLIPTVLSWMIANVPNSDPQYAALQALVGTDTP